MGLKHWVVVRMIQGKGKKQEKSGSKRPGRIELPEPPSQEN
jgi:hypothetical protein